MRNLRPSALLAGTATAALLLSACGSDGAATTAPAPVAPVSSASAPAPAAPSDSPSPSISSPASPSSSAPVQEVVDDDAELEVEDQSGNGRNILVEEVELSSGTGFVAVYTRDGRLVGSAEVGSGSTSTVDLDTRIPRTGEYRAVLFGDDGDDVFDSESDPRVVEGGDDDDEAVDDDFDYRLR